MQQSKIHEYLSTGNSRHHNESPFLSLPRSVRDKIYAMVGLRWDYVDLNRLARWTQYQCLRKEKCWCDPEYGVQCWKWPEDPPRKSPYNLLLVNKTVSLEVKDLLYARNCFAVCQRSPGNLNMLESLSSRAMSGMQALMVHLTPCRCLTPYCVVDDEGPIDDPSVGLEACLHAAIDNRHDRILGDVSRTDKAILKQWGKICSRLATHIIPGKVKLFIVCHVRDTVVAERILRPLTQLPLLRDCGICLGSTSHPENSQLTSLARHYVRLMTVPNHGTAPSPFPFLRLPTEIQLRIMRLSDLVLKRPITIREGRIETRWQRHYCNGGEVWSDNSFFTPRCFCPVRCAASQKRCDHASYTGIFPYFLLNKAFTAVATDVFYSLNTFVITHSESVEHGKTHDIEDIYRFLSRLSPRALRKIRHLKIIPMILGLDDLFNGILHAWRKSIFILANQADPSLLTLTIKMVELSDDWLEQFGSSPSQFEDALGHLVDI
ncbi:unnamed protein product [Periconia digitata]|uniref:F-box domain-containing protein n=1 Tax=Periconia digitata TaxID=1303443 RepID=A0A9W4XR79_9PLEO|nr:unnamed protein product [Periconia digitata]